MPKLKSHSGAKKRFKLTKSGKVKRAHAYKSHILTKKDTKRCRRLRSTTYADKTNDATKLYVLGEFDRVLSLSLLEKAAVKREELKKQAVSANTFSIVSESGESDPEVEAKIQARQEAKKAKNYAEADRIRNELKEQGIELTDIPHGATWKRI